MNETAFIASIDKNRRVWGQYRRGFGCSFYIVNGNLVTELHLTIEGTEALRLVIDKLQNDASALNCFRPTRTISTQGKSPKKKILVSSKKAGLNKKTKKRPSLVKKKKK